MRSGLRRISSASGRKCKLHVIRAGTKREYGTITLGAFGIRTTGVQKRTIAEWLHVKRLLTDNEFLVAKGLALLLEWRKTSFGPEDSIVIFNTKFQEAAPLQIIAYERPLMNMLIGSAKDGGDVKEEEADLDKLNTPTFSESISERLWRKICTRDELKRLVRLFEQALPERSDLVVLLGQAVVERINVRDIPYREVPLICSALYLLQEYWREYLL